MVREAEGRRLDREVQGMKKWNSRESMRRFRCRKRCESEGLPIPEWAAIRDQKKKRLPDTPRRVYFRNYYHNNKTRCYEYTRRYRVRARCEMDGLPVPEWAALRLHPLTPEERRAKNREYKRMYRIRHREQVNAWRRRWWKKLKSDPVRLAAHNEKRRMKWKTASTTRST